MLRVSNYDIPSRRTGTTMYGLIFTLIETGTGDPVDISDAAIKIQIRTRSDSPVIAEFSIGSGLSFTAANAFEWQSWKINLRPFKYVYDVLFSFSGGEFESYIQGTWLIYEGVTQE